MSEKNKLWKNYNFILLFIKFWNKNVGIDCIFNNSKWNLPSYLIIIHLIMLGEYWAN